MIYGVLSPDLTYIRIEFLSAGEELINRVFKTDYYQYLWLNFYTYLFSKGSEIFTETVQLSSSLFLTSVSSTRLKSILIKIAGGRLLNDP